MDTGFCMSMEEHVGKTEKNCDMTTRACCSLVATGKILLLNLHSWLWLFLHRVPQGNPPSRFGGHLYSALIC